MQIKIYGASDDLVEVEGGIREEFNPSGNDPSYLIVSEGSVFKIVYDDDGIWRVNRIITGTAEVSKVDGDVVQDTNDIVTVSGDIRWIIFATDAQIVKAHTATPEKEG